MANASSYPLATPKKSDIVLITQTYDETETSPVIGNPTKTSTIGSIIALANAKTGVDSFNSIDAKFKWSAQDPEYQVSSTHIGSNGRYSKLGVDFNNLELEEDSTYKLIMERSKRGTKRSASSYRKGGYKRNTQLVLPAPYSSRLSEIPITAVSGQKFDFRFDLYFRDVGDESTGFPCPSGAGGKIQKMSATGDGTPDRIIKKQAIAFRVEKTTGGEVETSNLIGELWLVGQDGGGESTITFKIK